MLTLHFADAGRLLDTYVTLGDWLRGCSDLLTPETEIPVIVLSDT